MSAIEESVEVRVPLRTAYDQWTQFEEFPRFMDGVEEVRQLDDTRLHWRASIGGVTREWDAQITEQVPDERVAWQATDGHPNDGMVRFEAMGPEETRVILQMEHEPEGFLETVGDKLGMVSRQAKSNLKRFKEMMESQQDASGEWRGEVKQGRTAQATAGDAGVVHETEVPAGWVSGAGPGTHDTEGATHPSQTDDSTVALPDYARESDVDMAQGLGHDADSPASGEASGPTPETRDAMDDHPRR
jgi:carbon monoxide dehydrogenase subunit G